MRCPAVSSANLREIENNDLPTTYTFDDHALNKLDVTSFGVTAVVSYESGLSADNFKADLSLNVLDPIRKLFH